MNDTDEPRTWEQIRADAVAAVRAARPRQTADIIDIVLSVCDEETVRRLSAKLIAETGLRAMEFRDGASMDLEPARDAVAVWVGIARGMLGAAPNYSETRIDYGLEDPPGYEMTVKLAGEFDRYVFRLQRAGKLTPHEARMQAEQRAETAETELARIRGILAAWDRAVDEIPDAELDEIIWAASPYRVGPGVNVSVTPEAREQARRLCDALSARMRCTAEAEAEVAGTREHHD